jgi:hypothetical protein
MANEPRFINSPIDEFFQEDVEHTNIEGEILRLRNEVDELKNNNAIMESILDEDELLWKALHEDRNEYDLPREKQWEQMRRSWSAFCTNPIAHRQIEHITNFVTGEDLKFVSPIPDIEDWIKEFWFSPQNQMPFQIRNFSNGFGINGNVFVRFWISHDTGKCVIREVPPFEIWDIIHDPDDVMTTIYYKRQFRKHTWHENHYRDEQVTEFIPSVETIRNPNLLDKVVVPTKSINLGLKDNQDSYIYHIKIPTISGRKWGMPSMASHLFWLREYKTLLRHITNMNKARSAYVMDVTIHGSEREVQLERKKHRIPPAPGSVIVHTDRVEYEYKNPNTGSANTAADLRSIKLMSVAGSGFPEHIITGDASNANFSSTKSTNYPFYRQMQAYQEYWKAAYQYGVLWVVLWAGYTYGPLQEFYTIEEYSAIYKQKILKKKRAIDCLDIIFPMIDREELDRLAAALRVFAEVGIASKETMSSLAGFDWKKEKPKLDAELEEQMGQMADQQSMMADMQNQAAMGAITPELMMSQMQGEQDIDLTMQAKAAGVPEASPAVSKAMAAMGGGSGPPGAGGPPPPPGGAGAGGSKLMQSKILRRKLSDGTVIMESTRILRSRVLSPTERKLIESRRRLRTRVVSSPGFYASEILEENEE